MGQERYGRGGGGGRGRDDRGGGRDAWGGGDRGFAQDRAPRQGGGYGRPDRAERAPQDPGTPATGVVKFFNSEKGFGFVEFPGGGQDAFLHVSALDDVGGEVAQGATINCHVAPDPRQPGKTKVVSVQSVDASTATPGGSGGGRPRPSSGPTTKGQGKVVRYDENRGFGHIRLGPGNDVFFHVSVAQRAGVSEPAIDDEFEVEVETVDGRPRAKSLRLLSQA